MELRPDPRRPDGTELSYGLLPEATGRGPAREAVRVVLGRHRWERGARHEVIAVTRAANTPSRRLLAAVGLGEVERFEEFEEWGGRNRPSTAAAAPRRAGEPPRTRPQKGWTSSGRASGVGP
ncbi:GNAT family N-acetyltransferase [Streptomyces albidoflavus]